MKRHLAMGGILLIAVLCMVLAIAGQSWCQDNKKISKQVKKGVGTVTQQKAEGKTDIRILSEGIDFTLKTTGSEEEQIEHIPIVLWGKATPQALLSFYYKQQYADAGETLRFAKHSLDGRQKSLSDRLSGALDDYPITYKVKIGDLMDKEKWRAKSLVKMESLLTADVNGDGVEELIIPKTHGDIDVYDTARRLFSSRPWDGYLPLALYDLNHVGAHVASLENRDVVFLTFNRSLADGFSGLSEKEKQKARQNDVAAILRIDHTGIHPIVPYGPGINWILSKVWAVGALNYPGSKDIDEIVILHEMEETGDEDTYLTRLKPDGQVIDQPRKFYSSYSEYGNTKFIFVPQSRQTVMEGAEGYYFITPEKPVNWARQVNLPDQYAGILRHDKGLVVVVRDNLCFYAFDEEERFYLRDAQGKLRRIETKKPIYTIQLESERHKLADVFVSKQAVDHPQYLVVQYREMQAGQILSWQVKLDIAKKYMKDDVREQRLKDLKARAYDYDEIYQESVARKYKQKFGKRIKLPTLDDVKKHFPEYYPELQSQFEETYRELIWSNLLMKPDTENKKYFKDYDGYCAWFDLRKVPDDSEMVYAFISDFKITKRIKITDYHHGKDIFKPTYLRFPTTTFRLHGNALTIVTYSRKKEDEDAKNPVWLQIREEGGRN